MIKDDQIKDEKNNLFFSDINKKKQCTFWLYFISKNTLNTKVNIK